MAGWTDQDATWYGGRPWPSHFVLDPLPRQKGGGAPKFSAHVYCGQTAGWIKMPLGMEVGLSPGDFVLHGDPPPPQKGGEAPNFRSMFIIVIAISLEHCNIAQWLLWFVVSHDALFS